MINLFMNWIQSMRNKKSALIFLRKKNTVRVLFCIYYYCIFRVRICARMPVRASVCMPVRVRAHTRACARL
jgi:hypothetical protein